MQNDTNNYGLVLSNNGKQFKLAITANDSGHAQAQAADIIRSLDAESFSLTYENLKETTLSRLFTKLAFNSFDHKSCAVWEGAVSNKSPCAYVCQRRVYIKNIILKYLDIPTDLTVRPTCENKLCVNPYHFVYLPEKNSKLSGGDLKLLVAYRSQGAGISQLAEAFKVHRSTIYRTLKNERLSTGSPRNCVSSRR